MLPSSTRPLEPSRRALMVGAAVVAVARPGEAISTSTTIDAFVRLQGDAQGQTSYNYLTGMAFALLDDRQSVPLFGIDGLSIDQFTRIAPDRYTRDVVQIMLFRSLETGKFEDSTISPIDGQRIDVVHFIEGPQQMTLGDGGYHVPDGKGGDRMVPIDLSFREIDSVGFASHSTLASYRNFVQPTDNSQASTGERDYLTEMSTFRYDARHFRDQRIAGVPTTFAMTASFNFFPFLFAGRTKGRVLWHADGLKLKSAASLPRDVSGAIDRHFPHVLKAPFEGTPRNSFREFARTLRDSHPQ